MDNSVETRTSASYDDRRAAAPSTPVGVVPQSYGATRSGPMFAAQDMAGIIVAAVMILGPLLTGALRAS